MVPFGFVCPSANGPLSTTRTPKSGRRFKTRHCVAARDEKKSLVVATAPSCEGSESGGREKEKERERAQSLQHCGEWRTMAPAESIETPSTPCPRAPRRFVNELIMAKRH